MDIFEWEDGVSEKSRAPAEVGRRVGGRGQRGNNRYHTGVPMGNASCSGLKVILGVKVDSRE